METTQQKALRMACDTFLAEYEGTPDLATLDQLIATATPWEPFESYDTGTVGHIIRQQATTNMRELQSVRYDHMKLAGLDSPKHPAQWMLGYQNTEAIEDPTISNEHVARIAELINPYETEFARFVVFCEEHNIAGMPGALYEHATLYQLYAELCCLVNVTLKA